MGTSLGFDAAWRPGFMARPAAGKKLKVSADETVRRSQRVAALRKPDWEAQFALPDSCKERARRIRSTLAQCRRAENHNLRQTVDRNEENDSSAESRGIAKDATPQVLIKSPHFEELNPLERSFFECDAVELAPRLLGKILRRDEVLLQITEVEAYRQDDTACHCRFGKTTRTAPLFGPGGHAYVYLCYGLHVMLNVVADKHGVGAAVLIRSCAPLSGLETIQSRRKQSTNKPILLTGPGKVGQALGLTTQWTNHPLYTPGGLELLDGLPPEKILVGPRVGIEYASPQDVAALWRFAVAGSQWVSAPRNTLQPLAVAEVSDLSLDVI